MAFTKCKEIAEVQEAFAKLEELSRNYSQLIASGTNEDRAAAQKVWANMSASYWEIVLALVEANTQNSPAQFRPFQC